jgi:hypothetical protein
MRLGLALAGLFLFAPSTVAAKKEQIHVCIAEHFLGGEEITVERMFRANGEEIKLPESTFAPKEKLKQVRLVEQQLHNYISGLTADLPKHCPPRKKRERHYHYFNCDVARRDGNQSFYASGKSVSWRYEEQDEIKLTSSYSFFSSQFIPQLEFPKSPYGGPTIHWDRMGGLGGANGGVEVDGKTVWTYTEAAQFDFGGKHLRKWTVSNVLLSFNHAELAQMMKTGAEDASLTHWDTKAGLIKRHTLPRAMFSGLGGKMQSVYDEYIAKSIDLTTRCKARQDLEITITLH